jgi:Rha family phage regulatory protein
MTNLIPAVQLIDGYPRVSSLSISEHFEKAHADVLKSVRKIASDCPVEFNEGNFSLVEYTDEKGELRPMYQLSRDGFTLVAMGFTGRKALAWKGRYIEAFNAMERALLEGIHGQPVQLALTPSTVSDRKPLEKLIKVWCSMSSMPYAQAWTQVNAYFNLDSITHLPVEWIPDALAFVQSKIDALPKALPEPESAPAPAQMCFDKFTEAELFAIYTEVKALQAEWKDLYDFFNKRRRISKRLKELYFPIAKATMERITKIPSGTPHPYVSDYISDTLWGHEYDIDTAFSKAEDAMSLAFAKAYSFLYALNGETFSHRWGRRIS